LKIGLKCYFCFYGSIQINKLKQKLMLKMMKKIALFCLAGLTVVLSSCGLNSGNGELVGSINRPIFRPFIPFGMVYIPSGTYHTGQSDQDINYSQIAHNRQISISAFYMDETEITNNEYRQFTNWVRDSIAAKLMGAPYVKVIDGIEYIDWTKAKTIKWGDKATQEKIDAIIVLLMLDFLSVLGL
jgi:formylglycine-generating enzyme required for sulfatase activity